MCDITNYIYLLQEREFVKTKENIYKIGMTKKENHKRFNQYPKGSILLFQMICYDCKCMERIIMELFKKKYSQRKDIGNEYFEGNYKDMIDDIYTTIKNESDFLSLQNNNQNNLQNIAQNDLQNESHNEFQDDDTVKSSESAKSDIIDNNVVHNNIVRNNISHYDIVCKYIESFFPDYEDDIVFGGTKKFITISKNSKNEYMVNSISSKVMDCNKIVHNACDNRDDHIDDHIDDYIDKFFITLPNVPDKLQYFDMLIRKEIIRTNCVYDIFSINFINMINKTKIKINVEYYDAFVKNKNVDYKLFGSGNNEFSHDLLHQIFHQNMIINDKIYAVMYGVNGVSVFNNHLSLLNEFDKLDNFKTVYVDIGIPKESIDVILCKINNKYYDYNTMIKKYIPFCIRYNDSGEYYILDRFNKYIGLDAYLLSHNGCFKDHEILSFNINIIPWNTNDEYSQYCKKYISFLQKNYLHKCLNDNNNIHLFL